MKLYLLVSADEFELPFVCENKIHKLFKYFNGRKKERITEIFCRSANTNSKTRTVFGKCFIRIIDCTPDIDDLYFTLHYDNHYLFRNFTDKDCYQTLGITPRTFYRHKHDIDWLLHKVTQLYAQLSQPPKTF